MARTKMGRRYQNENYHFGGLQIGMVGLNDGEEEVVAERLAAVLKG